MTNSECSGSSANSGYQNEFNLPMTTILPGKLYLGNLEDAHDEELLAKNKIDAILNLCHHGHVASHCREVVWLPILDGPGNTDIQFNDIMEALFKFLAEKKTVLVHCAAGMSRSATIVIAYFAKETNLTFEQSESIIRKMRPIIMPHHALQALARKWLFKHRDG